MEANKNDASNEQQLRAANQQLLANEQELQAANQQLSANEQELQAANQQLSANEQELRVANQQLALNNKQLIAQKKQLKAANKRLVTNEQQLQAANQQLRANEQELFRRKKLYKAIFEGSISGLAVYDVINGGDDFVLKEFNSAAEDIENIQRKDIIGKSILEVFPGIKKCGLLDVLKRVYKTGEKEYFPIYIYDGERIIGWRDNYVFKLGSGEIVASYNDVTEQKKAEDALEFQARLLDQIQDYVVATDLEGHITYVNDAIAKRRGVRKEDLIGNKTDVLGENLKLGEIHKEILEKTISEGQWHGDVVNYTVDGEEIILDCKTYLVYDEEGKRNGLCCVSKDITQLKRDEEQLLEYQHQLQDLVSQLAIAEEKERKRIASKLHDDICQDMVFLKMNIDSVISKDRYEKHDEILKGMSKTIAGLLDDLQNVTNDLGSHLLYELGLKSALKEWITREIENKHKIIVNFTSDDDYSNLDTEVKAFLFRSIKELLINVVKHAKARRVKVSLRRDETGVKVRVFDDGVGLKGTKCKVGGDYKKGGYGLFSIKERLNYFRGDMKFISENEAGTRVEMTLPMYRGVRK